MDNINLALTLLIAGFIIVFMVLVLLIIIITVYGKLIQAAQKTSQNRKEKKKKVVKIEQPAKPAAPKAPYVPKVQSDPDEIPGEIVAVIAAAVDAICGDKPHRIKSVRRSRNTRSAWGSTGVMQNTRPF